MTRTRILLLTAIAAAAALITGGCDSVSTHTTHEPTIVHDHKIALDFTTRPTRASFGMEADSNLRAYQRVGPMYDVSVTLPTGTFHTPAFLVEGATDPAGGAHDHNYSHDPKYFDIQTTYPNGDEALQAVRERAKVLGISQDDLASLAGDLGSGATVPQSRVVDGLIKDWLAVSVAFADQDGAKVQVTYQIDIDTYHNPAVDKVVHGGAMRLDLTRSPSRADLGFLPSYSTARISPEPGKQIRLTLHGAGGEATIPVRSVLSGSGDATSATPDPEGTEEPSYTIIDATGSPGQVRKALSGLATVFDIPDAQVRDFADAGSLAWSGSTDHYAVKVQASADPDRTDASSSRVKVTLTWR